MSINGVVTPTLTPPVTSLPSAMPPFNVSDIRKRTHAVQEVMRGVMKERTHFGTIPGTPKPSLWKAGAEVLCMTFRLAPMLDSRVVVDDLDSEWSYSTTKRDGSTVNGTCVGFFEVEAACSILGPQGEILSRCSARCNNREAKYRSLSLFEIRNTILKMAEKRAFVSSVLMATGASDIFTQDLEDFPELLEPYLSMPVKSEPKPVTPTEMTKACQGLSQKREEWLFRAANDAHLPKEALALCLAHLRSAGGEVVKTFFDDLAKRKKVFEPFMVKVA